MGRFVLHKPAASASGAVLSSACMDKGKSVWKGTTTNSWQFCYGDENLITLKVIKDNPMFDIEWNLQTDHQDTWNSQAFRLVARYGTNSNANDSAWKGPNIMDQHSTYLPSYNVCGRSSGIVHIWRPTGFNLVTGNYIKFAIQRWGDSSGTNHPYMNQSSENMSGDADRGDDWQGGGFFMRVRELDPSFVTVRNGNINTSTGNA
tara:strand:- start:636 stop:1247 length:612 start_codon:yes stop_codon:yes gene_type:complete